MRRFNILMTNYNNGEYIETAILSIIKQTFKDWYLIIVDDASTDNSCLIIEKYVKLYPDKIKFIRNIDNKGYSLSLREGVKYVSTDIFGIVDSDDAITIDALEIMYKSHMQHPSIGLIYSQFMYCDDSLSPVDIGYCGNIPTGKTSLEEGLVSHFKTFKLKYYLLTDGFHKENQKAIDKDIVYKMEEVSSILFVNRILYMYRCHEKGISQGKNIKKALKDKKKAKWEARERRKRRNSERT